MGEQMKIQEGFLRLSIIVCRTPTYIEADSTPSSRKKKKARFEIAKVIVIDSVADDMNKRYYTNLSHNELGGGKQDGCVICRGGDGGLGE